ncbi:CotD family spore coat protein [Gracilibacillus alcaliphilus]|uniref:CotD family spore coat protein n=1 Tax=Gracilibacillus alcaliphilus TaxID=1401441 RepID=UPI00195DD12A|nr:CotD family spore coat protein [Gracilibacillus alcaliphilus]MBM7675228.1 spore coat protein D [Gracilibacillus alcaliphilus]
MRHYRPRMGCRIPEQTVVHPTKCNVVHTCSENVVNHIHPTHTTVVNHHLPNQHYFPRSTSANQVNMNGGPMAPHMNGCRRC